MNDNYKIAIIGNKDNRVNENVIEECFNTPSILFTESDYLIKKSDIERSIEQICRETKMQKSKCKSISGFKNLNRKGRM